MPSLLLALIPPAGIGFWFWMLVDMIRNDSIPSRGQPGLRWPPETKDHWIVFFILFSIFTAGYYYFTVYRHQQ